MRLLLLSALAQCISAAELIIALPPSLPHYDNPASLPPSTHATLLGPNGDTQTARLTRSHTLTFQSLKSGDYLLDIHTRDFIFQPVRVDVTTAAGDDAGAAARQSIEVYQTYRGNEWDNKGPKLASAHDRLAVDLHPFARKQFYQQRTGFDVLSFFKSPMILMGLVTCGLVFGLPYMMENMDPEMKAEMAEMQQNIGVGSGGAASQIQNFDLASWMAGKSDAAAVPNDSQGQAAVAA